MTLAEEELWTGSFALGSVAKSLVGGDHSHTSNCATDATVSYLCFRRFTWFFKTH